MKSSSELKIYSRQMDIPGWGRRAQDRLKKSRVFIAGAGGLGSPAMLYLAAAGVGTLRVCDFDKIDITNLNRQILHKFSRIGELKVDSARMTLNALNPHVSIEPLKQKITSGNAEDLVGDSDIILDCLDNFRTRQILNRVSVLGGIPMIHAGVSEMRGQLTFLHPPATPCLACLFTTRKPQVKNPILGATAGVIGTLQALEAIKYLTETGETLRGRMLFWDGASARFESIIIKKDPRCRVCGTLLKK